jgi:hypothetical protein
MHRPSVRVRRNHDHLLSVQHALLAAERATPAAVAGSLSLNASAADDLRASVETLLDTLDLEGRLRDAQVPSCGAGSVRPTSCMPTWRVAI